MRVPEQTDPSPFLIVQISDPHIGADWGNGDPVAMLSAVVESVRALEVKPDAVLISGDLADHATDAEYEQLQELLAPLDAPLYVLPGNHDDRNALRRHFGVPGGSAEPVQYAADLGPLRLVVLDSTRPGEDRGELDATRLNWLEATLNEAPKTPTLLAMHYAPLDTGMPEVDEVGLPASDRRAFESVIEGHPQILRIVAGHVHQTIAAVLGGRAVLAVPSTYVQARLSFASTEIELTADHSGFAVHALLDGELISHVQHVRY
jgi:Icc protein